MDVTIMPELLFLTEQSISLADCVVVFYDKDQKPKRVRKPYRHVFLPCKQEDYTYELMDISNIVDHFIYRGFETIGLLNRSSYSSVLFQAAYLYYFWANKCHELATTSLMRAHHNWTPADMPESFCVYVLPICQMIYEYLLEEESNM